WLIVICVLLITGKSTSNSKEVICPDDKYKEEGDLWNVEAQTAFLGPNLWEKTLPYDADLKVTQVSIITIARSVVAASVFSFFLVKIHILIVVHIIFQYKIWIWMAEQKEQKVNIPIF
uniref:Uncharacterized protein n=1 Tax=Musca domestica TaxID=7370 RepID=A0A1I8NKD8_MUSDO